MSCSSDPQLVQECAICLDNCLNGVRLSCNHVFCYLCVKGSAQQSNNRCPVCRRPIANDYFENPDLIEEIDIKTVPSVEGMQWQYEGRNGWWLYDSRHSRDIEKAFAAKEPSVEVLIAGFVYVIDFQQMIQFRRHQPNRIRRIRRHPIDPNITKGVAGLRTNFNDVPQVMDTSIQNSNIPQIVYFFSSILIMISKQIQMTTSALKSPYKLCPIQMSNQMLNQILSQILWNRTPVKTIWKTTQTVMSCN